jgi:hypothetical protein
MRLLLPIAMIVMTLTFAFSLPPDPRHGEWAIPPDPPGTVYHAACASPPATRPAATQPADSDTSREAIDEEADVPRGH